MQRCKSLAKGAPMSSRNFLLVILALLPTFGNSCSSNGDQTQPRHGDNLRGDADVDDEQASDTAEADYDVGDSGPLSAFPWRIPTIHPFDCGAGGIVGFWDIDYLCKIQTGGLDLELYLQASPNACEGSIMPFADMTVPGAWIKRTGENLVWRVSASFEAGGNHRNDSMAFAVDGTLYRIWHSSFGIGFRACVAPDCLLICTDEASVGHPCDEYNNVAVNGCARNSGDGPPPNPVICIPIASDGSVSPYLDPWQVQASDESYPILPCEGDLS